MAQSLEVCLFLCVDWSCSRSLTISLAFKSLLSARILAVSPFVGVSGPRCLLSELHMICIVRHIAGSADTLLGLAMY